MAYQHRLAFVPKLLIYLFLGTFSVVCLAPFVFIITGSITDEREIVERGFSLIPSATSDAAWVMILHDYRRIVNGYFVTVVVTLGGTFLSLLVTSLLAYPLSVSTLRYRNILAFFVFFTMIFSGGMVPWYIIVSRVSACGTPSSPSSCRTR